MGAKEHTMAGLSGIGDLMLTCLGDASRNKAVGIEFGRGRKIEDILSERARSLQGVAEGVATAPAAERLAAKLGVAAPMMSTCAQCLRGELDAKGALEQCMSLPIQADKPVTEKTYSLKMVPAIASHVAAALAGALLASIADGRRRRL
jgi:glycerol-3-phosphate dehydrogenase